ncbi:MAG TPA: META domain-containing protein [Gemmatimonadaceae bacterium]|nr:META domain-containing protein [Gemmatimonadaceae bacterium]
MPQQSGIRIALVALAVVACAKSANEAPGDEPSVPPTTAAPAGSSATFENTHWRLIELNGKPATTVESQREPHLRFQADSGRVAGATGCNILSGPFTRRGDTLTFGALITTKMACLEQSRMDQERDFVTALENTASHEIRGDTLVLKNREARAIARLIAVVR